MAARHQHNRIRSLFFLVALAWAASLWVMYSLITELQTQDALRQNRITAQWGARLLEAECQATLNQLRLFAQEDSLSAGNRAEMNQDLRRIAGITPSPVFAAVYQANGKMLACYPHSPNVYIEGDDLRLPSSVSAPIISEAARLKDRTADVLLFYLPLGRPGHATGFLQVCYRQAALTQHITDLRDSTRLFLVTRKGNTALLADCIGCERREIALDSAVVKSLAQQKGSGERTFPTVGSQEKMLAGYAASPRLNVALVALQPARAAAFTGWPLIRLVVLSLPMLVLMFLGTRALLNLNDRQNKTLQQLAEQNEQLRAADSAKSDFLANISHDLWTPLAGIQVAITGLLDPQANWNPVRARDSLQAANRQVDRLTERVRNLLEMARLEANAEQTQKEPCDLADIVASALERLQPLLAGRRVEAIFPPVPLLFDARYAQMEIVVLNLLENAIKYSPAGSPLVMRGEFRGRDLYFSLQDQGPGVERPDSQRIFEKFYRAQKENPMGGAGLGLAICKKIVEAHSGVIGVTNLPGGGADFWFSVPAMPPFKEHRR